MKKKLYQWVFFRLMGWKIAGALDPNIKKCVMIVVPHTSWHDFYLGVLTRGIVDLDMNFVAKKELFVFPFNYYFKWMGGAALNRKKQSNKVEAIADIFDEQEVFRLAIAPEGTRKKVGTWKTGFYYIAQRAKVPIVPVAFDYGKREVRFFEPFYPTGQFEKDMAYLQNLYQGVWGREAKNSYTPDSD
ncbi:1-acyl-sn-glycerol-3-phosphate acyltransferase [Flavobacterium sp. JP2137]|uniref:1-acyl-sn-glycerol-3-phosphate acyltransferase n=1 Tax=Flavobacterium sp. JP2137 TaxID=3414510 RepID=UPI003D2FA9EE